MRRLQGWLSALWILAVALSVAPAHAEQAPAGELEYLAQAVASHPDDPDLLFAFAQSLAANRREAEAVEHLLALDARWPEHRRDLPLLLGRLLHGLGRSAEAVPHLERAAALDPESGAAQMLLGLALRADGRNAEAEAAFERAAAAAPELESEAWLLAGLSRLSRGDRTGGDEWPGRAREADPRGEAGRTARLVLEGPVSSSRFRLQAYGGFRYDSNVTLDSGDFFTGLPPDQSDSVFFWGTGASLDAIRYRGFEVTVGGGYDQSAHLDLDRRDTRQFGGTLSTRWRPAERAALRLDSRIVHAQLGGDPYALAGGLRPSLLVALGPRAGWLRGFAGTDWYGYQDRPVSTALERDGFAWGGGLEHGVPLPWLRWGSVVWYGSWERYDSQAQRDTLAGIDFDGDYDRDGYGGGVRLNAALPWRISGELGVSYLRESYANTNLTDALTDDGVGTDTPERRLDGAWTTGLRLVRPFGRFIDLEVSARYVDRQSNVDVYDYDRWVSGLAVRIHTP
jgi:tetratricopeptide (TPR) repeat protein